MTAYREGGKLVKKKRKKINVTPPPKIPKTVEKEERGFLNKGERHGDGGGGGYIKEHIKQNDFKSRLKKSRLI